MKRYLLILLAISVQMSAQAQESKKFTRYSSMPEITEERKQITDAIPLYRPKTKFKESKSVNYIDNSILKFFPDIFNQAGNSCSQASGIRYIMSYEMNRLKDTEATNNTTFAYHYTWNFLNDGVDVGSWYYDGYELAKDNGVPILSDFPDNKANEKTWMSGYDKYYRAMHNRIADYSKLDAGLTGSLEKMKQYLIDHGDGSETGGLINFSGLTSGWDIIDYNGTANTPYKYAIRNFGDGGAHAMSIVGFDDDIEVDVNSDGEITDDEVGAFIIVNSWGGGWCSNGRAYMPYKLLYMDWWNGGIGNGDGDVYMMDVEEHTPTVAAKVNLTYTSRNDLWVIIGVSEDANASYASKTKTMKVFKKLGGDFYMQGGSSESHKSIEIGLDFSELIEKKPDAKTFFIKVKQSPEGTLGEGKISSFTIYDYRNSTSSPKVYTSEKVNVTIEPSTELSVTDGTSGINKYKLEGMKLYPNPSKTNDFITIEYKQNIDQVRIINLQGQVISSDPVNADSYKLSMPAVSGVYFIEITSDNKKHVEKILVN